VQAQYPDRPIRLIVPFPPGGVYDAIARPLADRLKGPLGSVVVENLGGAGGSRGTGMAARAPADGYTLLLGGTATHVVWPLAARRPVFDPVADFEPVTRLAVVGLSFVAHPATQLKDLKGLIEYARANPGKLSYGTPGAGTTNHFTGELFKTLAGVPVIVHVPYTGAGPALNDLIGGHIPLAVVNVTGQVLELARSGKLVMLAMTTPQRMPYAPEVPTAEESGVKGLLAQTFFGLFAPKDTPRAIIDRLAGAVSRVLAEQGLQDLYDKAGFTADREARPDLLREFLAAELARWKPVIDASGFKID
jgi:tripartite-type tricarboxylate transporter receptor subunit TctC